MRHHKFLHLPLFLVVFAAITAIVMLLWNAIMPGLTGVGFLNFWQAGGIIILSRLLFGGIGKHHHGFMHGGMQGGCGKKQKEYRHLHDMMHEMSPEERKDFFKRNFTNAFGHPGACRGPRGRSRGPVGNPAEPFAEEDLPGDFPDRSFDEEPERTGSN